MSNENNKMQVDIENLFKQNVNDLSAIKELYRKLKEVEEKITQIKYIDNTLVKKIKKEYENLKKQILEENVQIELTNDINDVNSKVDIIKTNIDTNIENINSQIHSIDNKKASKEELNLERTRIDNLINISSGAIDNAELSDARIGVNDTAYDNLGNALRLQLNEKIDGDIPNSKYYWEKGALNATGGEISYANETHSRTISYMPKRLQGLTNKGTKAVDVIEYNTDGSFSVMYSVKTNNSLTFNEDKLYRLSISEPFTNINNTVNNIVFITKPTKYETMIINQNTEITNIKNKVNNITNAEKINLKKLLCIGDSLTQGDYGSNPPGTMNVKTENYPYYLNKYLNKFITTEVVNAGRCGFTATTYWESKVKKIDFTNVKTIVIMLGTNGYLTDTIESDTNINSSQSYENYKNTHTGSYCKIIEYCMKQTNNLAQIFLVTPPKTNQRVETSMLTTVEVIKKIGKKYSLPVFDGYNEFGISPTNFDTMLPIDGLHGGKIGYKKIATYIGSNVLSKLSYEIED